LAGNVPRLPARAAVGALALACVASVVVLARAEQVASVAKRATSEANEAAWSAAVAPADVAAAADPDMPPYLATAGITRTFDGRWTDAVDALAAEVAIDDLPQSWLAIAAARIESGDEAGAREALQAALRVGVQQAAVAYAGGTLYDRMADAEAADEAYRHALVAYPSLAADESWEAGSDRFETLVERAMAETPVNAWELALMTGDPDRAASLAGMAVEPDLARLVIPAWGGDHAAVEAVQAEPKSHPLDLLRITWAARVSAHAGDAVSARRFRDWAEIVEGGASVNCYEVRVTDDPADERGSTGNLARFYGHYTYRRPTPWDLVAAGVPRLVLDDEASSP
jgi:tetratricopeptide (TPR) repeat protein